MLSAIIVLKLLDAIIDYLVVMAHIACGIFPRNTRTGSVKLRGTSAAFRDIHYIRSDIALPIKILKIEHRDFVLGAGGAGQLSMTCHDRVGRAMNIVTGRTALKKKKGEKKRGRYP